jgi:catechol 2,3-dioxygenase
VSSQEALERLAKKIEESGAGLGWTETDYAHGPAYRFASPDGHAHTLLWELDYFVADDALHSKLRNRPSKRPLRGVPVRRIDHVNLMVSHVPANREFFTHVLDFQLREQKIGDGGAEVARG